MPSTISGLGVKPAGRSFSISQAFAGSTARVLAIPGHMRGIVYKWLPDFWLPQCGQYAEVKGFLYHDAFARLMGIARGLGGNSCATGHDMIVLGHMPSAWDLRWPCQLHKHQGKLYAVPWTLESGCPLHGSYIPEQDITPDLLLAGFPVVCPEFAEVPLQAARKYRFPATSGPLTRR